jgi:hypothetical protein
LATHFAILPLEFSLPTLTVAIILPQLKDIAKQVSSKNEECSEYGTGKSCIDGVEFRAGWRFTYVKVLWLEGDMIDEIGGSWSAPAG